MASRTPHRRRTAALMVSALAVLPALAGCTVFSGADAPVARAASSAEEPISMLYSLTADSGTLTPAAGSEVEFLLTLNAADRHTIWFTDRPTHAAGTLATSDFVADWVDLGFTDVPPNVAVVIHTAANDADTLVAELQDPAFDDDTDTFTATITVEADATGSARKATFEQFASTTDAKLPASFSGASLFINDESGRVVDGCIVAPHVTC